jgi:anaerobic selenocysteine-containing dehydrogenase
VSRWEYRACDLCEAICGLAFRFDDDQLTAIRGDHDDPFSRGHICPKGNAILDLESDPDRLRRPLLKRNGDFVEIGWDEAFALAGERLAAIQAEHGANAVGAYLGNPNVHHFGSIAYAPNLLRALRSRNVFSASSVDQWPHQLVNWLMFGHQFLLPIPDVDRTDYLLMLGANPVASNGSLFTAPGIARRLKALTERGRLVVVDPRRTETAEIASEHLFIRPGGDALFLVALLQRLRTLGLPRLDRYQGKVRGLDRALAALEGFGDEDIEAHTGIDRSTIARIAGELWRAPTAVVYGRIGISTQAFGSLSQWLVQLVNLYTGNLDREGGALFNEAALPVTGPGTQAGHHGVWHSRVRGLPEFAGELPVSALAEEILTPGEGRMRALITFAGNPVLSTPAGRRVDAALAALDFMLSIDIYVNETTRHADLILPPASGLTQDHYDLIFNAFAVRRVARLNVPILPMAEGERADWQIINALGESWARAAGKTFTPLPSPRVAIGAGLGRGDSGLSLADLEAAPHGIDLGPLRPSLLARLQTESGAIECAPELLLADLARLRDAPAPVPDTLQLIGRRHVRSNNSWMHNAPRLVKGKPRHHLLVHPQDLLQRGIVDGAKVRVASRVGSIEAEVRASDEVMRGVVCLPHGFGHARGGVRLQRAAKVAGESYNDLSDPERLDAPSGNAALSGVPVTVEPA